MQRRRFLQFSIGATVGLSALVLVGERTFGRGLPRRILTPLALLHLSAQEAQTLRAVALRLLDGCDPGVQPDGGAAVCLFVDRYLTALPKTQRQNVRGLLHLVELFPLATGKFARFGRLRAHEQDAMLADWQTSRVPLLRQGFCALKALCCLAYYDQPTSFAALGYSGPLL